MELLMIVIIYLSLKDNKKKPPLQTTNRIQSKLINLLKVGSDKKKNNFALQ